MILTLRTDNPDAEIGLFDGKKRRSYHTWHADRNLANELLATIYQQLQHEKSDWIDVHGIVVYQGPGSFTGLRIGITVANSLAYGQRVPIVGARGDDWVADGLARITAGEDDTMVLPFYGAEPNITPPRK